MDGYPSEIRYRFTPLVALLGASIELLSIIKQNLSYQLLENATKVPSFRFILSEHSNFSVTPRKKEKIFNYPPRGIFSYVWLFRVCYEIPSAIVFVVDWDCPDWKTKEYEYLENLESISLNAKSRNIQVVLLIFKTGGSAAASERLSAFKRRSGIDAKNVVFFPVEEVPASIKTFEAVLRRASDEHYFEEIRFVKKHKEKVTKSSQIKLFIRHHVKVAFYFELRSNIQAAIRYYASAYNNLLEVKKVWKDFEEVKALAEIIVFKLCYHYLALKNVDRAISQFHQHINYYRLLVGDPEYEFRHFAWLARQYRIFSELLQTFYHSNDAVQSNFSCSLGSTCRRIDWSNPGYYYQMAATHQIARRECARELCAPHTDREEVAELLSYFSTQDEDCSSNFRLNEYIGQTSALSILDVSKVDVQLSRYVDSLNSRTVFDPFVDWDPDLLSRRDGLIARGVDCIGAHLNDWYLVVIAQEIHTNHSQIIVRLLSKARDAYLENESGTKRILAHLSSKMAHEYYLMKDYQKSIDVNQQVIHIYRQDRWTELLMPALRERLECSKRLEKWEDFFRYGVELLSCGCQQSFASEKAATLSSLLDVLFNLQPLSAPLVHSQAKDEPKNELLKCRVYFDQRKAFIGTDVKLHVEVKSCFPSDVRFSSLALAFNDPQYDVTLIDDEAIPNRETPTDKPETRDHLLFSPDSSKTYTFTFQFANVSRIECTSLTLTLGQPPSSIDFLHPISHSPDHNRRSRSRQKKEPWHDHQPIIDIHARNPEISLSVELQEPAFLSEHFPLKVSVKNQTTSPITVNLSIYPDSLLDRSKTSSKYLITHAPDLDSRSHQKKSMPFYGSGGTSTPSSYKATLDPIDPLRQTESIIYFVAPCYEAEFYYALRIFYETETHSDFIQKNFRIPVKTPLQVHTHLYDQFLKKIDLASSPSPKYNQTHRKHSTPTAPVDASDLSTSSLSQSATTSNALITVPQNSQLFLVTEIKTLTRCPINLVRLKLTHRSDQPVLITPLSQRTSSPSTEDHAVYLDLANPPTCQNATHSACLSLCTLPDVQVNNFSSTLEIHWTRTYPFHTTPRTVTYTSPGPNLKTEPSPFVTRVETSSSGTVGRPIEHRIHLTNQTNGILSVYTQLIESPGFAVAGEKTIKHFVNARNTITIDHNLIPLKSGILPFPTFKLTNLTNLPRDSSDLYSVEVTHSSIYVAPSESPSIS
ncbi:trafficking protein particle complex subunit 11-like [Schistocerca gregaria]|uniref:trafficking protein particle complex subunit 11-like n=1 Tax=Schistocerca gregaria TaxID=7010 RepID=UPI00211E87B7|nr:trafficking protein particle complex subunit 11-like [Schistocerca gregaria]